jgi:hypothetical protein
MLLSIITRIRVRIKILRARPRLIRLVQTAKATSQDSYIYLYLLYVNNIVVHNVAHIFYAKIILNYVPPTSFPSLPGHRSYFKNNNNMHFPYISYVLHSIIIPRVYYNTCTYSPAVPSERVRYSCTEKHV